MASQQQQQLANHADNMQAFRAGLTGCLRSWSALKTAVDKGWGGGAGQQQSYRKAEDLRNCILEHLDGSRYPPARLEQQDLEDNLAIYMEEEFGITLEDDSERQVAATIWNMYEGCYCRGDTALVQQIVTSAEIAAAHASGRPPAKVQSMLTEHDESDDDNSDGGMMDTNNYGSAAASTGDNPLALASTMNNSSNVTTWSSYASEPLFGDAKPKKIVQQAPVRQMGEAVPIADEPMVDDDGFLPVTRRK